MNKNNLVTLCILASVFAFWTGFVFAKNKYECAILTDQMQQSITDANIESYGKDIDYLTRLKCRKIIIRAINTNNEMKTLKVLGVEFVSADQKIVTVEVDGKNKTYDFRALMSHVIKVECGDTVIY